MPLVNSPHLYTGGNERFNSNPTVNMYSQLLARKAAKDEALNQYFTNLEKNINTAGVRNQDLTGPQGGINDDIAAWRNNWLSKKEDIKKGGMAQQQHMAQFQDILRRIGQSKGRAKTELEVGKAKFEGKYDPDEDDIRVLDVIGRSIYDKSSYKEDGVTEYGWGDLSPSIPDFDAARQNKFWTSVSKDMKPSKAFDFNSMRKDRVTGKAIVPFTEALNDEQIKNIAENAGEIVRYAKPGDPKSESTSALRYYKRILNDPESDTWKELNAAYQSVYGQNDIVSTPEQAAKADAILKARAIGKKGEQVMTDQDAAYAMWLRKQRVSDALIRGRQKATESEVNNIYRRINDEVTRLKNYGEKQVGLNVLDADAQGLIIDFVNKGRSEDYKIPNEDIRVEKTDMGEIVVRDATNGEVLTTIPQIGTNLKVQPSVKEKRTVIEHGQPDVKARPGNVKPQQPKPGGKKMVKVSLPDGRTGEIPEDKVSQFLKDNPGSKRQ